jgi:hypothetical protein
MAVSVQELLAALTKAGANPQASGFDMERAIPGLKQNVQNSMQASDSVIPGLRDSYRSQLDQMAQMDQKLGSVYGDPKSNLFIEHAGARQKAVSGASEPGYRAASNIASSAKSRQSEIDSQASQAVQLFQQLTTVQKREEALAEKARKASAKKSGSGKKSIQQKVAESNARAEEVKKQRLQLAGISPDNKKAADVFFNQFPKQVQEQWIREGQSDEQGRLSDPKPEDLKNYMQMWTDTFKPKKPAKSVEQRAQESIQYSDTKKKLQGKERKQLF